MLSLKRTRRKAEKHPTLCYRRPMQVTDLNVYRDGSYYVCPRCGITLDRDFAAYCDRCGQRLSWRGWENPARVYIR